MKRWRFLAFMETIPKKQNSRSEKYHIRNDECFTWA